MCGICGIFDLSGAPVQQPTLETMIASIRHRGPDDEGYYLDGNLGLGNCRLSIIDLEGGHQPICNEDETVWIVHNGEVYNYLELRATLLSQGHRFRTNTDTEVVLHLYEQHGEACVRQLNGMFAFAIWDSRRRRLFLARDRLGIKPLYYAAVGSRIVFASEIKAILAEGNLRPALNPLALMDYLHFQVCLDDKTFFQDVHKLLPAHTLSIEADHPVLMPRRYWNLAYGDVDLVHDEDYFADHLLLLLQDIVRIRLRSDVPVGAHLSGGLDSSTTTCLASSLNSSPLHSFTGGFQEGPQYDETAYAREVADHAGTVGHEVYPTADDLIADLPRLIYALDEPVAGPGVFPQYHVCQLAAQHVKVVLGGQGGDEVFGGYMRYLVGYLEECLKYSILFDPAARSGDFVATLESIIPNLKQLHNYVPYLQYFWQSGLFQTPDQRYFRLIDRADGTDRLLASDFEDAVRQYSPFETFSARFTAPAIDSLFNRMTYFDITTLLPGLLQVEDRTSMAVSLESRTPLLDHRLLEFISRVPPTIKFKGGQSKYLLRRAVRSVVPRTVLARTDKMGFPVPLTEWLQGPLRDYVGDLLQDLARRRDIFQVSPAEIDDLVRGERRFGRKLWGLLCLELWFQAFIDTPGAS